MHACVCMCVGLHDCKQMSSQEVERSIKGELDETNPKGGRLSPKGREASLLTCILERLGVKGDGREKDGGGGGGEQQEHDK